MEYQHSARCTGCPFCSDEMGAVLRMRAAEYARWLTDGTCAASDHPRCAEGTHDEDDEDDEDDGLPTGSGEGRSMRHDDEVPVVTHDALRDAILAGRERAAAQKRHAMGGGKERRSQQGALEIARAEMRTRHAREWGGGR
jgi:hypothetical protein